MTLLLGGLTALLGVAMIVTTLVRGGGPLAVGVLIGGAFVLVGCARAYLALGPRSRRAEP